MITKCSDTVQAPAPRQLEDDGPQNLRYKVTALHFLLIIHTALDNIQCPCIVYGRQREKSLLLSLENQILSNVFWKKMQEQ